MRNPQSVIVFSSLGKPADVVAVPEGGVSIALRHDWLEDAPTGLPLTEWHSDPPGCEFVGDYEHIKQLRPVGPCEVWARAFCDHGFYFDSPRITVVTYPVDYNNDPA